MAFTPPPQVPQRGARATFSGAVDAFLKWMAALPAQLDAFLARLETIAAGGAYSIPYTIRSESEALAGAVGTAGGGNFALTNGGNTLLIDVKDKRGAVADAGILAVLSSTSARRGSVRLQKQNDPSVWMVLDVVSPPVYGGSGLHLSFSVAQTFTSVSGFNSGDAVMLFFERNGDKGDVGNADKKVQIAPAPVNGIVTVDYRNGNCLVWGPTAGSTVFLNITNWPAAGTMGEFWIEGYALGAANVKLNESVRWLRPDGTGAVSDNINTNHGATLRPDDVDNVLLWGRGGKPGAGKVAR